MKQHIRFNDHLARFTLFVFTVLVFFVLSSCENQSSDQTQGTITDSAIIAIDNEDQFNKVWEKSGEHLLMFEFYADWCSPCKELAPVLEKIAKENKDKVTVYKINTDRNSDLLHSFRVRGIPYVVFVKNQENVFSLTGLYPRNMYLRVIEQFSESTEKKSDTPDGEIIDGIRVIRLSTSSRIDDIYVYRGETINLIIEKIEFPYSIHIPEYGISKEGIIGQNLDVKFKAKSVGVFPIFCNGQCPSGDGAIYGRIVVMQYEASDDAQYKEIGANQAIDLIKKNNPLIIDVRTPNEYYSGHIENAMLIPLQQLGGRLSEIEEYKEKDILLYCRSGNRSTVAAEILIKNGFKKLYNLRYGIKEWQANNYKVVKYPARSS